MVVESDEDLASFIDEDDFAVPMRTPNGNCSAIFDTQYVDAAGVEQMAPSARVLSSKVIALSIAKGLSAMINDVEYTVRKVEAIPPDGAFSRLILGL